MRTAKNGQIVHFFVSRVFLPVLGTLSLTQANARGQILELNRLPEYKFFGQDSVRRRAVCRLEANAPQRDFAGRHFQEFKVWVEPSQFSASFKYKGSAQAMNPDAQLSSNQLRFKIQGEGGYLLELITSSNDTNDVATFNLYDLGDITGARRQLVNCNDVRSVRR